MSGTQHKNVRVRFAPSPTGHLHIGGLRTALFNVLFARHYNGTFLLRIEDTDKERSKKEFTDSILDALAWTAIQADEPPVIQSDRIARHAELIQKLVDEGKAYRCYCTTSPMASKETYLKYDGACRAKVYDTSIKDTPFVVRLKIPLDKPSITFDDLIRGPITFAMDQFDDFIIARSDGTPVYNLVVVIDDHDMGITHVIRGEDHISNTPKQILLYRALGFEIPAFAHVPLILGPTGKRLSKRDAATAVLDYRVNGYLPDALCNYLARLGWSHGDQEIFSREQLIALFTLEGIGKSGAVFDQEKLDWINGVYIREAADADLLAFACRYVDPELRAKIDWPEPKLLVAIALYKERVATVQQLVDELYIVYNGPLSITQEDRAKWITDQTAKQLKQLIDQLHGLHAFDAAAIKSIIKQLCTVFGIKMGQIAQPIRLAIIGKTQSPGIFELLTMLGKQETLKRLEEFVATL